jgi:hypothetical protein
MSGEKAPKLLTAIVPRGEGLQIAERFSEVGFPVNMIFGGYGTAPSQILQLFGLADNKKDVVMSLIAADKIPFVFRILEEEFSLGKTGAGIGFTIQLSSVSSRMLLNMCNGGDGTVSRTNG